MPHKRTNAPPGKGEALEAFHDWLSDPQDSPHILEKQAGSLARRFGLALTTASLIADLAFGESAR